MNADSDRKARLLIVEDESVVAMDIQSRLSRMGYQLVARALSGEDAVRYSGEYRPDLVLMDIHLRGNMDGIAAAEMIRERFDIPVIFITAYADQVTLNRAKLTDAFGYILKPFQERELYSNIELALYKHQVSRKLREHEKWLDTTLNNIADGVVSTDTSGIIRFVNMSAELLFGKSAEELTGCRVDEFIIPSRSPSVSSLAGRGEVMRLAHRNVSVELKESPVIDDRGNINGHVYIFRDITTLLAQEAALKEAKARAETASRAKSDFLSNISHELRTPLNSIIGMTALAEIETENSEVREYLRVVRSSGAELLTVINTMLDYSKIEFGTEEYAESEFDPADSARKVVEPFLASMRKKGIQFSLDISDSLHTLYAGDVYKFRRILTLLIENAVKFTVKGSIRVAVTQEEEVVSVSVKDTGVGIPADRLGSIFEPFTQADGSPTRQFGGIGLGLTLVKQYAELIGGTIDVESQVGYGSTFTVRLPLHAVSILRRGEREPKSRLNLDEVSESRKVAKDGEISSGRPKAELGGLALLRKDIETGDFSTHYHVLKELKEQVEGDANIDASIKEALFRLQLAFRMADPEKALALLAEIERAYL